MGKWLWLLALPSQTTNPLLALNLTPLWINSVDVYRATVLCLKNKHTEETQVWKCEIKHHQPLPTLLIFNDSISETTAAIIQRVWTLKPKSPCTISNGKRRFYLNWPEPAQRVLLRRHYSKFPHHLSLCNISCKAIATFNPLQTGCSHSADIWKKTQDNILYTFYMCFNIFANWIQMLSTWRRMSGTA